AGDVGDQSPGLLLARLRGRYRAAKLAIVVRGGYERQVVMVLVLVDGQPDLRSGHGFAVGSEYTAGHAACLLCRRCLRRSVHRLCFRRVWPWTVRSQFL